MTRSEYNNYSGKFTVKILQKYFGCVFNSQKGSHVKFKTINNTSVIIPLHKSLAYGTFKSVLSQADISEEEFYKQIK